MRVTQRNSCSGSCVAAVMFVVGFVHVESFCLKAFECGSKLADMGFIMQSSVLCESTSCMAQCLVLWLFGLCRFVSVFVCELGRW